MAYKLTIILCTSRNDYGCARPSDFNVARTVADCFKFRNRIGLDVAIEALHETCCEQRLNMDELWHYAAMCRVANVMRPYVESLGRASVM